jgi:hypothetical protein
LFTAVSATWGDAAGGDLVQWWRNMAGTNDEFHIKRREKAFVTVRDLV